MWNIWVYSSLFVVILLFHIIKKCTFAVLKYLINAERNVSCSNHLKNIMFMNLNSATL